MRGQSDVIQKRNGVRYNPATAHWEAKIEDRDENVWLGSSLHLHEANALVEAYHAKQARLQGGGNK